MAECFPYGVFTYPDDPDSARIAVRAGEQILDLADVAARQMSPYADLLAAPTLDPLLAAGPTVWHAVHRDVRSSVTDGMFIDPGDVVMRLPFTVADVATFGPGGSHPHPAVRFGRSGAVTVSDTPVVRPRGPSTQLGVDAQVGFVVGVPSERGDPIPAEAFADHVFGMVLVSDWCARDVPATDDTHFQTSVSPWVVPLDVLASARFDVELEVRVNDEVVSRSAYRESRWAPGELLAHLTSTGASVRTGDLFSSGEPAVRMLDDGDRVVVSAKAPAGDGTSIDLGEVRGQVLAAR
ncbi:MAG TPA: fumarylacetoacetate hydrolase family protein [Mycobacteriales bacterium]|nr:fumarylacetoacetate hydrolase family protein [Mycobacteriales bacterium]